MCALGLYVWAAGGEPHIKAKREKNGNSSRAQEQGGLIHQSNVTAQRANNRRSAPTLQLKGNQAERKGPQRRTVVLQISTVTHSKVTKVLNTTYRRPDGIII